VIYGDFSAQVHGISRRTLYKAHGDAPLMLQAHNNEVHYRNLWLRKL
jgi:hypothetical protein